MSLLQVILLAFVQGLAELLPVSSSAHVIVAAKLMGLKPSSPEMMFLIVMLHTGTMFAVIFYFWRSWMKEFFSSREAFRQHAIRLVLATAMTAVVGLPLIFGIEKAAARLGYHVKDADGRKAKVEVESLADNLSLVAGALASAGVLILIAGLVEHKKPGSRAIGTSQAAWIGAVQGLCLPFRGFSRSGATISTGLLLGSVKARVEEFSFALAVIITPPAIARQLWRVIKKQHELGQPVVSWTVFAPSLLGMVCAFVAGLLALAWLSRWLERGRWHYFGIYCLVAASAVFALHLRGF